MSGVTTGESELTRLTPSGARGERALQTARAGILYSQCWEDVACARAALRVRPGEEVLAIGAAGDNVLALLQDQPGSILAVDVNPAQTALIELKRAAVRLLPPEDVPALLGAAPSSRRLEAYEQIRGAVSPSAQHFWDDRPQLIAMGVIHAGRFERYLALFRAWALNVVPGRRVVRAMLAATSLEEQRRLYHTLWDTPLWRGLFRVFFSRRLLGALGRHPTLFAHCQVSDVGGHFLERARVGLTEIPIRTNPYATYMLSGGYDRLCRTPAYLVPQVLEALQPLTQRVEILTARLEDALTALPEHSIDAFYLSDVFETFDGYGYEAAMEEIARVGRPGARICYWNNLVERSHPPRLSHLFRKHDDVASELHRRDRGFLYSRFVVESVQGD